MKRILSVLFVSALLVSSGCTKNGHDHDFSESWKISFYWDEKDETSIFSEYFFIFKSSGQVMAHKGTAMYTGTWSKTDTRFQIDFGTNPVLSALNSDWLMVEETDTSIKLKDGNPAQENQLHFIRE